MSSVPQDQIQTPHFRLPLQFSGVNGGALLNEQDTADDLEDCVRTILAFPLGYRIDSPTFGIPDTLFQLGYDVPTAAVRSALVRWEDRMAIGVEGGEPVSDEFIRKVIIKLGIFNA
jgi:phage baseplate assembly protein W